MLFFQLYANLTISPPDTMTMWCMWGHQRARLWSIISSHTPCTQPITTLSTSTVTLRSEPFSAMASRSSSLKWLREKCQRTHSLHLETTTETQKRIQLLTFLFHKTLLISDIILILLDWPRHRRSSPTRRTGGGSWCTSTRGPAPLARASWPRLLSGICKLFSILRLTDFRIKDL